MLMDVINPLTRIKAMHVFVSKNVWSDQADSRDVRKGQVTIRAQMGRDPRRNLSQDRRARNRNTEQGAKGIAKKQTKSVAIVKFT